MTTFAVSASYTKKEMSSELKPVINNTVNVNGVSIQETPKETNITIPKLPPKESIKGRKFALDEPLVDISTDVNVDGETTEMSESDRETPTPKPNPIPHIHAFERRLLSIALAILSSQDKVLMNNIIDQSGDIILSFLDLREIIQLATGKDNVIIKTEDPMVKCGCIGKVKMPFSSKISSIRVDDLDFHVKYNRIYNTFSAYKISLTHVVV